MLWSFRSVSGRSTCWSESCWMSTVRTSIDMNALCPLSNDFPVVNKHTSSRLRTNTVVTIKYNTLHNAYKIPITKCTYKRLAKEYVKWRCYHWKDHHEEVKPSRMSDSVSVFCDDWRFEDPHDDHIDDEHEGVSQEVIPEEFEQDVQLQHIHKQP